MITSNHSPVGFRQFGLSEVRFLYVPVWAREPEPTDGTVDVAVADAVLDWRAGRQAVAHDVSFGTDPEALTVIGSVADSMIDPGTLDLGTTYYWKVDEVNEVEAISTWEGQIWSFSTQECIVIDDFESYDDEDNLIYDAWIDGWSNGTGSTVGYLEAPFAEETTVHGGQQSMPLYYDNAAGESSEATLTFDVPQDWTQHDVKGLILWFCGNSDNAEARMYVVIDGAKVAYDGDAGDLLRTPWQMWYVDLTGLNVTSVAELTIGLEGVGSGLLFIDDIMLTSYDRQLITPVDPGTDNLVGHWMFDEGSGTTALDSSGHGHDGTITGTQWVAGPVDGALSFDGVGDYVVAPPETWSSIENEVTVAFWAYGDPDLQPNHDVIFRASKDPTGGVVTVANIHLPSSNGMVFWDAGSGTTGTACDRICKAASPEEYEGSWQYWVFTKNAITGEMKIYLNGALWHSGAGMTRIMTDVAVFNIGANTIPPPELSYAGMIDDFRLYDRELTEEEVAWLAGRTEPFDNSF
jgi:hypothetical protein